MTEDGERYYFSDGTHGPATTQWEAPDGATGGSTGRPSETNVVNTRETVAVALSSHGRTPTFLPDGWSRHFAVDGTAYYEKPTHEVQWERPPGNDAADLADSTATVALQ